MTTPERFAAWAMEADPKCHTCRGMGYAYQRQQYIAGPYVAAGLPPPELKTSVTRCPCAMGERRGRRKPEGFTTPADQ